MSDPVVAVNIPGTFGALLVGGIVAAVFSGIVTVQTFAYFKYYSHDVVILRVLVATVWLLDFTHTIFVSVSLWDHLIAHFGDQSRIDYIPWCLAITIALTAVLTYLVHGFYIYRIHKLSLGNFFLSVPLAVLATARLCFASLTTNKLITLKSLKRFVQLYTFSYTSGLALSSALDVFITALLCYLLRKNQKKISSMNHVLDKLILYSFENGSLTCAAVVVSMITWLKRGNGLIFLGLHFVISKFYANSLLATLNTRRDLRPGHRTSPSNSHDRQPIMFPDHFRGPRPSINRLSGEETKTTQLQINVNKTTMSVVDSDISKDSTMMV